MFKSYKSILYPLTVSILFYWMYYIFFLPIVAPSDPLEYIQQALKPEMGFRHLDRILLWYWLRLVAFLGIDPLYISPVATLILSTFILALGSFYLYDKVNQYASFIFVILFSVSPIVLGNSAYTYPTQLMVLILLSTFILMDYTKNINMKLMVGGMGYTIALFSKIQAYIFIVFLLIYLYKNVSKINISHLVYIALGGILGIITVLLIVIGVDGMDMLFNVVNNYFFQGTATAQYLGIGRGHDGIPLVLMFFLEPSFIFAFVGSVILVLIRINEHYKFIGYMALVHLFGLLFIYVFTGRRGPPISNYVLDFYIFGSMASASVLVYIYKRELEKLTFSIWHLITITLLFFIFIIVVSFVLPNDIWYFPFNFLKKSIMEIIIDGLLILLIYYILFKVLKTYKQSEYLHIYKTRYIPIFILIIIYFVNVAVADAKFKRNYWNSSHELCQILSSMTPTDTINVQVRLNRKTIEDGSSKCKVLFNVFYRKNDSITFGKSNKYFDYIITDDINIIKQKVISKKIIYEYIFNAKKNQVWMVALVNEI